LAKNGSFGFTKRRLVCRAKPNVFRQKEILKNVNGELFLFSPFQGAKHGQFDSLSA
jgi:hypothetical protein